MKKMKKIDITGWKEFDVMDFFSTQTVKNKVVIYDIKNFGITPVYASESSYKNNIGYIDDDPEFYVNDEQSMYVIFGDHTKSMRIIETNFSVTDNVKVLSPKIQSKNSLFFIMTIWLANIPDLGYSRHWSIAKKTKIKLPVKSDNTPDWDYMENFIKRLETKEKESTSNLISYLNNAKLNKVDTSKWKEFDVRDLFLEKTVKNKVMIYDIKNFGNTPVYASESSYKNNIGYIDDDPEFYVNDEQSMYVIFGDHTKSMRIIETNFSVTDNVKVLSPKIQSKNILFFVMTSWLANIPDLGYSRHWSIAKKTKIKLPVKSDNSPDWNYMEKYIENLKLKCNISRHLKEE